VCLVGIATGTDHYSVVIAANRDEYFRRPARVAQWWPEQTAIFGGKDLQAGGSWLAINRRGQFAVVTNWREGIPTQTFQKSRGSWVTAVLTASAQPSALQDVLTCAMQGSGPGSIIYGHLQQPSSVVYRGQDHHANTFSSSLGAGIYGLSNAQLDAPWPKTETLKQDMQHALNEHQETATRYGPQFAQQRFIASLFAALARPETYRPDVLPNTGISDETEVLLSSAFVSAPEYGTRVSTVVLAKTNGNCLFIERAREGCLVQTEFWIA
jgi:uncharacterized protein with NRDE domain